MADTDEALAARMFAAKNHLERLRHRDVTLAELGELVAQQLGRQKAFDPSVVARWIKGRQDPDTRDAWLALAETLQVDPGWLAFGDASSAPAPEGFVAAPEQTPPPEPTGRAAKPMRGRPKPVDRPAAKKTNPKPASG